MGRNTPAPTASRKKKDRSGDKRPAVKLPPQLHALLAELAARNHRGIGQEAEIALLDHLHRAGLSPARDD
jgi:hypothetical protein